MGRDDAKDDDDDRKNEAECTQERSPFTGDERKRSDNNVSFVSEGDSERAAELRRQERRQMKKYEAECTQGRSPFTEDERKHSDKNVSFVSEGDSERAAELRRQERRRQMNTIHSRRKRERQKIEVEVLREQCAQYSALNLSLFHKNKRLEELFELAKQEVEQHEKQIGFQIPSDPPTYPDMQQQAAGLSFSGALQPNPNNIQPQPVQPLLNPIALQAVQLLLIQHQQQQPPPPVLHVPVAASLPKPEPRLVNSMGPSQQHQQQLQQLMLQQLLLSGMSPQQIVALIVPEGDTPASGRTMGNDDLDTKPPPKQFKG